MKLKKIRIEGFKSIYKELELNFEDIKGLWKVEGTVGAGKTTLGEAILWGLFGDVKGKNRDELISWGKKWGEVEVWMESKGHNIHIKRKIHIYPNMNSFSVEVDDEPLISTNKRDLQCQLETEYYDISKMTMELLCVISFNNFKSLATLSSRDTKDFLDQVFGFYVLTTYVEKGKELRGEVREKLERYKNEIGRLESQVEKINQLNTMEEEVEGDIEEIEREIKEGMEERKRRKEKWKEKLNNIEEKRVEYSSRLSELKVLGTNKAKEIQLIKGGRCPTCGAPIDGGELEVKEKEREMLLKSWKDVQERLGEIKKKKDEIEEERDKDIREVDKILTEKKTLKIKLEERKKREGVSKEEIERLQERIRRGEEERRKKEKEEVEWNVLIDILGGDIKQKILQSFIPIINKNIGEYSRLLHLPYLITFDETFSCRVGLIAMDKEVSISSLSTGQLKTVDICIIMGVLKALIKGCSFNCLFLDELFSNLDQDLRDTVCKMLKENIEEDKTVFIISHSDIDDNRFEGSVKVRLGYGEGGCRGSEYTIIKNK